MWRIYKEGQGRWARGILVAVVMLGAVFALKQLHGYLSPDEEWSSKWLYGVDWRFLVHGPILVLAAWLSLWLFNRPSTAAFLIDTEIVVDIRGVALGKRSLIVDAVTASDFIPVCE